MALKVLGVTSAAWCSRPMFSNIFSRNRVPMQRGEVMFFRSGALVLYFPVCGAHLWEAKMDHAETKSVPMQRGVRSVLRRSVPMQRGARFCAMALGDRWRPLGLIHFLGAHARVLPWTSQKHSKAFVLNGFERFLGDPFGPVHGYDCAKKRSHAAWRSFRIFAERSHAAWRSFCVLRNARHAAWHSFFLPPERSHAARRSFRNS